MKHINDVRREFLERFTRQLIFSSIKPITQQEIYERIKRKLEKEMPLRIIMDTSRIEQIAPEKIVRLAPMQFNPVPRVQKQAMPVQQISAMPNDFTIDKLDFFIKDKSITMVECPGPGKVVLIRRGQITEPTSIILSKDEIDKIITAFSRAAKIPVIGGTFRVNVGNLTISAIISEITGTRFIIMNRM